MSDVYRAVTRQNDRDASASLVERCEKHLAAIERSRIIVKDAALEAAKRTGWTDANALEKLATDLDCTFDEVFGDMERQIKDAAANAALAAAE